MSEERIEALGESDAFLEFQEHLSQVAPVERPILLVGERGTGKELAASRLHFLSRRWEGSLVPLNCAALSPSVLESELFGHEAGAYTGAAGRRQGRFEAADGGTLFLDEVGLIPMVVQEKILRVVEYRRFERVGGSKPVTVDVRIIGATNAHLPALAEEGRFKQDLLDRLSFEVLVLPPLRKRAGDVPVLARHFAARMAHELGFRDIPGFSSEAMKTLEAYHWPGNVRELKNVVERAVYRSGGRKVSEIVFDPFLPVAEHPGAVRKTGSSPVRDGEGSTGRDVPKTMAPEPRDTGFRLGERSLPDAVRELELAALTWAMDEARNHQGKAAELLGLTYHQFRGLFRKHRVEIEGTKP